jgi:hypothetical protein
VAGTLKTDLGINLGGKRRRMRAYFTPDLTKENITRLRVAGILPENIPIQTDPDIGRKFFRYQFRYSTHINWEKIAPYVEALTNLIQSYCYPPKLVDGQNKTFLSGVYIYDGENEAIRNIKIIVTTKRNQSSGVAWQEFEIYGKGVSPEDMSLAHSLFIKGEFKLSTVWDSGILIKC